MSLKSKKLVKGYFDKKGHDNQNQNDERNSFIVDSILTVIYQAQHISPSLLYGVHLEN